MLIKADSKTWIEVPNNSTEEYKKAKIEKYNQEKQRKLNSLKHHRYTSTKTYKKSDVGCLYDKRINLKELMTNYR